MKKFITFILLFFCILTSSHVLANDTIPHIDQDKILANAPQLNPQALRYAIKGYQWALRNTDVSKPDILTVIDFSLPSYDKRLWVINLKTNQLLMKLYTTQGKNSGLIYATQFSNARHTDKTSLGVYKVTNTYQGAHGLSERLQGLEQGINNNALVRSIVIHPAWYASPAFVAQHHRAGRSWGCFAIDPAASKRFIQLTNNGSILFAYGKPEQTDAIIL